MQQSKWYLGLLLSVCFAINVFASEPNALKSQDIVGKVTTPTMLLTGESDYRTPISETEQYYQAPKIQGVKTAMVRIPNAFHSIYRKPSNLMTKVEYILWWFKQHNGQKQGI